MGEIIASFLKPLTKDSIFITCRKIKYKFLNWNKPIDIAALYLWLYLPLSLSLCLLTELHLCHNSLCVYFHLFLSLCLLTLQLPLCLCLSVCLSVSLSLSLSLSLCLCLAAEMIWFKSKVAVSRTGDPLHFSTLWRIWETDFFNLNTNDDRRSDEWRFGSRRIVATLEMRRYSHSRLNGLFLFVFVLFKLFF